MRSKSPIIPTILSYTLSDFQDKVNFASQVGNAVHLDFVNNSYSNPTLAVNKWPKLELEYTEAHLMGEKPENHFQSLKEKGVVRAIVQIETINNLSELVQLARSLDLLLGFAVNLDTDLSQLRPYLDVSNYFQVMGVPLGRGGQRMDRSAVLAVSYLRKTFPRSLTISFDGGISEENIASLQKAGVDYFLCGSAIFSGRDWQNNYQKLMQAISDD